MQIAVVHGYLSIVEGVSFTERFLSTYFALKSSLSNVYNISEDMLLWESHRHAW